MDDNLLEVIEILVNKIGEDKFSLEEKGKICKLLGEYFFDGYDVRGWCAYKYGSIFKEEE